MKCYIQNGFEKMVLQADNEQIALCNFFNEILQPNKMGDEVCGLATTTLLSDCGFIKDLTEMNMTKEINKMRFYRTSYLMKSFGRTDIAKFLRECEKKDLKEIQKVQKKMWCSLK